MDFFIISLYINALDRNCPNSLVLRYACKASLCQFWSTHLLQNVSIKNVIASSALVVFANFLRSSKKGLFVGWCYVVLHYVCKTLSKPSAYNQVLLHKTCGCIFGLRLFVLSCVYKCFCKVIFSARNVLCELFAF